ncbi:thioredoxin domain-containing protein [Oculatella sp. LEGE 06141]|uniref:thioredoxin domain-containing protein n=1 Tax=Oculatella sp. LEGE 06141 TaxID=1828648 RepID=UPI001881F126|nr:thioredoxin domain-containing protein [Oculatella sp. LEGE 06141]MBE9177069.1 thioredoxin domain-containing protein [Oculatella sp. LEGE 06141]
MTNRLAHTQSLYLRKHAENPIDWWPWSEEALKAAAHANKPIFLSIGYSSCHWCTVMEGEAFSNEAIADYMNAHFLPIKVDREERPDLDSIYMQALQLMTGQGGWPLNVFLTPGDLVPFYGGTYFPVEPKYGRPGFLQILQGIRRLYDTEMNQVEAVKGKILSRLQQSTVLQAVETLDDALLGQGLQYSAGVISARGMGQSFPMIPYAMTALRGMRFKPDEAMYNPAQVCQQRGLNLALGGIYDHVGGGFHRYTVDPTWTVPHFEKMLYDNGQIVEFLADLCCAGMQDPAFERAIAGTVAWLQREMTAPEGYFYAAQDADSFVTPDELEPEEGAFYVWKYSQLAGVLADAELAELADQFMVAERGNFEGQIVLQRRHAGQLTDALETALAKLFKLRYGTLPSQGSTFPPARSNQDAKTHPWPGRIPPVTDTKMIVAWNSLMISGLARAAIALQKADYLELAAQAARFIVEHKWIDKRFHRLNYDGQASVLAQSEDYALFIKALLDLDQATMSLTTPTAPSQWLERAIALQDEFDDWLWSVDLGGYFNTPGDVSQDLVIRERSYEDNATPSANGVAIANLVRLALRTEDLQHLDRAERALQSFSGVMERSPQSCPTLFGALDWYRNHTLLRTTAETFNGLSQQYLPSVVCTIEPNLPPDTVGLVCQGLSCKEPARSFVQLQEQIQQSQVRA